MCLDIKPILITVLTRMGENYNVLRLKLFFICRIKYLQINCIFYRDIYIITFIWPQMVSELFQKVQDSYVQQTELGWKRRGQRQQSTTAASHFLQSLTELTTRLERYQQRKLADTEHHYQICGFVWKPAQYHQKGYFFTACVENTVLANGSIHSAVK